MALGRSEADIPREAERLALPRALRSLSLGKAFDQPVERLVRDRVAPDKPLGHTDRVHGGTDVEKK